MSLSDETLEYIYNKRVEATSKFNTQLEIHIHYYSKSSVVDKANELFDDIKKTVTDHIRDISQDLAVYPHLSSHGSVDRIDEAFGSIEKMWDDLLSNAVKTLTWEDYVDKSTKYYPLTTIMEQLDAKLSSDPK